MSEKLKIRNRLQQRIARLPRAALPATTEIEPDSQVKLREIIERFEVGWMILMGNDRENRVWGDCNLAPEIFSFVAIDEGKKQNYSPNVKQYQVFDVHAAVGGEVKYAQRHGFNTFRVNDEAYLVDLSFAQFVNGDVRLPIPEEPHKLRFPVDELQTSHVAKSLVRDGFVPLTDENLQEYMRLTSIEADTTYLENMSVELLMNAPVIPQDPEPEPFYASEFGLAL